jgi:hypothetical protein
MTKLSNIFTEIGMLQINVARQKEPQARDPRAIPMAKIWAPTLD